MTNLKYKILRKVHENYTTEPIRIKEIIDFKGRVNRNQQALKELFDDGLLKTPVSSDALCITRRGIEALESEQTRREDALRMGIRYWITTIIAISALIVSILK